MSAIKKLDARPMTSAEISVELPITALERFLVLKAISSEAPGTFDDARRRKDLFDALCGQDWADWDEIATRGLEPTVFETVHKIKCTKTILKSCIEICKKISGTLSGVQAFRVLDLYERANFVLTGDSEGSA